MKEGEKIRPQHLRIVAGRRKSCRLEKAVTQKCKNKLTSMQMHDEREYEEKSRVSRKVKKNKEISNI